MTNWESRSVDRIDRVPIPVMDDVVQNAVTQLARRLRGANHGHCLRVEKHIEHGAVAPPSLR